MFLYFKLFLIFAQRLYHSFLTTKVEEIEESVIINSGVIVIHSARWVKKSLLTESNSYNQHDKFCYHINKFLTLYIPLSHFYETITFFACTSVTKQKTRRLIR